ncbi:MAG: nucleoside hydrolase [Synoicihabitans sp.]
MKVTSIPPLGSSAGSDLRHIFMTLLMLTASIIHGAEPVSIIFDTDFESDADDVAALALLHYFEQQNEVRILAIATCGLHALSAPAVNAVNHHFGRPNIPVGVRRGSGFDRDSNYTRFLVDQFPAAFDSDSAPDSVTLYRQILAAQPDNTVTIVSVGYLTNLSDLLKTGPDEYSDLTGRELVAAKVARYFCMGGSYPKQSRTGAWGNFLPDPEAVIHVNRDWPTPIVYTGGTTFSRSVPSGRGFVEEFPADSMLRQTYEVFFERTSWAKGPDHHSADLIPVYIAARGFEPFFKETKTGSNHIFPDGTMEWRIEPDRRDRYYVFDLDAGINGKLVGRQFEAWIRDAETTATKLSRR